MDYNTAKDCEEKALRFANFCARRFRTELTDDQIAAEMGFRSAEILYKQLEIDGSPVCGVCGRLYPERDHGEEHKNKRKKRQPDLGSGRKVKLPDASAAQNLFQEALKELDLYISLVEDEEGWLEGNIEEGEFKGKHFITHSVDRDAVEFARREDFTEEGWRELCEEHGGDPNSDQLALSRGEAAPKGVGRTPSMLLTALIATYALANRPLAPLIKALHPDPESAAWQEMANNVDDLHKVAGHLAARARGGTVERGRGVEEITREEHFVAWLIADLDETGEEGSPLYEEARELLIRKFPSLADRLSPKEISRIRREHLAPPE